MLHVVNGMRTLATSGCHMLANKRHFVRITGDVVGFSFVGAAGLVSVVWGLPVNCALIDNGCICGFGKGSDEQSNIAEKKWSLVICVQTAYNYLLSINLLAEI